MSHTTKHGNTYSNEQWQEMKECFAIEDDYAKEYRETVRKMENFLRRQLSTILTNQKAIDLVVSEFKSANWDSENYQMSIDITRKIDNLFTRWLNALPQPINWTEVGERQ